MIEESIRVPAPVGGKGKAIVKKVWILLFLCFWTVAWGQEGYRLGPEDLLEINFPQEPGLNRVVRVDRFGNISLSPVGEIQTEGLTPAELSAKIVEKISSRHPMISQATVLVVQSHRRRVYVLGQVLSPGAHGFESMPSLWEAILKAGGATSEADLGRVLLIPKDSEKGEIQQVDLLSIFSSGKPEQIPRLRPGDTVDIPRKVGTSPTQGPVTGLLKSAHLFYVYGQVQNPGPYELGDNTTLNQAVVLAGGATSGADLTKVRVISAAGGDCSLLTYDLERYYRGAILCGIKVHPQETIMVPPKTGVRDRGKKILAFMEEALPIISLAVTTYLTITLLKDRR